MFSKSSGLTGQTSFVAAATCAAVGVGAPRHVDGLLLRRREPGGEHDDRRRRAAGQRRASTRAPPARASCGTAHRPRSHARRRGPTMPSTARCAFVEVGRRAEVDLRLRSSARRACRRARAPTVSSRMRLRDLAFTPGRDRVVVDQDVDHAAVPADRVGRVGRRQRRSARRRIGPRPPVWNTPSDWICRGLPLTFSVISSALRSPTCCPSSVRARKSILTAAPAFAGCAAPPAAASAGASDQRRRRAPAGERGRITASPAAASSVDVAAFFLKSGATSRLPRSWYETPLSIHSGRGLPSR